LWNNYDDVSGNDWFFKAGDLAYALMHAAVIFARLSPSV